MAKEFPLEPVAVKSVQTKHRKISGYLPDQQTIDQIKKLRTFEATSMRGQPPVIWDKSLGTAIYDKNGNQWLDFSSGVLITNAGHGHPKIVKAIVDQASKPLLTTYCFPNQPRIDLVEKLVSISPKGLNKVFLLSTGAEGTECALKLMRTHGRKIGGDAKSVIVAFRDAFHGRTMGSQQMGASGTGRDWIKNLDPEIVHVPFPDGFRNEDTSFSLFEESLKKLNINPDNVAGVISETYQGAGPNFMPTEYAQALRKWCDQHRALLTFDEVQAGFGRCGTMWGFQGYGVTPDLFCMGKGISSSLPISGIIGRAEVMDLYGPNEMTSTHSANPVCCAASLANINVLLEEKLVENAAKVGLVLKSKLEELQRRYPKNIGFAPCRGLVGGLLVVKPGTKNPDYDTAWEIIYRCFQKGLMMFAPVGVGGGCVKIAPPLCITEEALLEGCGVLAEAFAETLAK